MGTRGLYGIRKEGKDKLTYNHFDSYPDWLGKKIVNFCMWTSLNGLNMLYDKIELVSENSQPTEEQKEACREMGLIDDPKEARPEDGWYWLLRKQQGDLDEVKKCVEKADKAYMVDNASFIRDSLFCEYAYIINLDTEMLEFYEGFQKAPQEGNRYGEQARDGYYPCRLVCEFPLSEIKSVDVVIKTMNEKAGM